jgi:8-oxo-dGTP pyrophosphatase MutT (NUDIX family)
MASKEIIKCIQDSMLGGLPGLEAQVRMAPPGRSTNMQPGQDTRDAAVLVTLFPKGTRWHIVFIERAKSNSQDRHRGQISLPGGKWDACDTTFAETALRETQEEVGIPAEKVQLIGQLSELFIPVSNFHVYPFVGFLDETPTFVRQEEEVESILEVPVDLLIRQKTTKKTKMKLSSGVLLPDVPYFDLNGRILWGATAMIMSEFLELLPGDPEML